MSPADDPLVEMPPLPAALAAALDDVVSGLPVSGELAATAALLDELRVLGNGPAPAPNAVLDALLAGAAPARDELADRRRHPGRLGVVVAAAALGLGSVGAAAAAGRLPTRVQDAVASAVRALTPFDVPRAHLARSLPPGGPRTVSPAPGPSVRPTSAAAPSAAGPLMSAADRLTPPASPPTVAPGPSPAPDRGRPAGPAAEHPETNATERPGVERPGPIASQPFAPTGDGGGAAPSATPDSAEHVDSGTPGGSGSGDGPGPEATPSPTPSGTGDDVPDATTTDGPDPNG